MLFTYKWEKYLTSKHRHSYKQEGEAGDRVEKGVRGGDSDKQGALRVSAVGLLLD